MESSPRISHPNAPLSHMRIRMATHHSAIMALFQSSRRRAAASLGSLLLFLLGTTSVSAFLFPAAPRACRSNPSPMTIATTMRTTQLFSSAIDEAPAPAQQQEQPVAQEQEQQQEQQQPARRRPSSPKPSGPWVLLEGLPYAAVESDVRTFLHGFDVQSLLLPMAPENTKRAGETKGIGIIKLSSEEEAKKAVAALNGQKILGRWVAVEQCVDPALCKTIKIRGVPFAATPDDLSSYFTGLFGEVESVIISHDRNGIAYVTFKEPGSAAEALTRDGCEMSGRWLDITLYLKGTFRSQGGGQQPQQQSQQQGKGEGGSRARQGNMVVKKNRLRLSGLPFEATLEELTAALEALDLPISNVFMPPYRANPEKNIGIAYLNIHDDVAYAQALSISSFSLRERVVYMKEATERVTLSSPEGGLEEGREEGSEGGQALVRDKPWQNRVYCGNLPFDITSSDLAAFFAENDVTGLDKIALPRTKIGTAYLAFDTKEMAEKAVALDGQLIEKDGRRRYLRLNLMDAGQSQQ